MAFWRLFYHVIWATQDRKPLLSPEVEQVAKEVIQRKSRSLDCTVHAINGAGDHIHVAVSIPPKLAIADWARQVKGLSAREVNESFPNLEMPFACHSNGTMSYRSL
ncbi:MAG: IS200/IS605 family transposase [Chloroflexi bacterium]|nr:IS200/IS605 family transposase [Chloroflexota bacterium]